MATTPKVSNASVASPVNRMAALGAVSKQDPVPVEEVDQYAALLNSGAEFYYENLIGEDNQGNRRDSNKAQVPLRFIKTALIKGTTECFASAFSSILRDNTAGEIGLTSQPRHSVASGIGTYEKTSRVVKESTEPRGESMDIDA